MERRKKVTQSDVAREASVSQGVVSYVLSGSNNGSLNVSAETRSKVLEAANRLGYMPAGTARTKGRDAGRSALVGANVLLVESAWAVGSQAKWSVAREGSAEARTYEFGLSIHHLTDCLQAHGVGLSIHYLTDDEHLMQWLASSKTCGIVWHASEKHESLLNWLCLRYPVVMLNRPWGNPLHYDCVEVDQALNVMLAADYLWNKGHRKIATFGHVPGNSMFSRRVDAYRRFVSDRGIRNYSEFQAINDEQHRLADDKVQEILDVWEKLGKDAPTGLILSDIFALRLLQSARSRGIRVPEQLSVIGVDNHEACAFTHPPLTSMEESFPSMCDTVVNLLMRRIKNASEPTQYVSIAPRIVERGSVLDLNAACATVPAANA